MEENHTQPKHTYLGKCHDVNYFLSKNVNKIIKHIVLSNEMRKCYSVMFQFPIIETNLQTT